ncbi:helix-turn-helix transcriptional regulator [Methylophilus sp. QUAN]|uniref:helix-turn-helix domain-containing protein n=1 Tax=Methylophilus sp. QUAN TaxID=2781020 RepID=UPI00188F0704|nr:helix-turn-helix transcriptional regulator [Methylophilus sp. QUAN]MBF4991093.1 helix-turn-helix transcriptional regulator [Methylophilus sp. QUAN]
MKLKQSEFAKLGGVSVTSQSFYETGKCSPTMGYIECLRKNGVDVSFIVTGLRLTPDIDWELMKQAFLLVQSTYSSPNNSPLLPEQFFEHFRAVAETVLRLKK